MRAIVFANGEFNPPQRSPLQIQSEDVIIAADGGLINCQKMGLLPEYLVGDFDSLEPAQVQALKEAGATVIRHSARKDYTDLELALLHAVELGASEIVVLGALGKRWDQTIANLLLPAGQAFAQIHVRLLDGPQEIWVMRGGDSLRIHGFAGDTVSLIPLCDSASGIETEGLEYPLHGESLAFGATRGISNVLLDEGGRVTLEKGVLLVVVIHLPDP